MNMMNEMRQAGISSLPKFYYLNLPRTAKEQVYFPQLLNMKDEKRPIERDDSTPSAA